MSELLIEKAAKEFGEWLADRLPSMIFPLKHVAVGDAEDAIRAILTKHMPELQVEPEVLAAANRLNDVRNHYYLDDVTLDHASNGSDARKLMLDAITVARAFLAAQTTVGGGEQLRQAIDAAAEELEFEFCDGRVAHCRQRAKAVLVKYFAAEAGEGK